MPTYRSITLALTSQYDLLVIPEYPPPRVPADPFSNSPQLIDAAHSTVSTYIPTYPSSQFWLTYSVAPPHPPKALYYFKLSINGKHLVSWGCGEDEEFKGKTVFALSPFGIDEDNRQVWERRGLVFGKSDKGTQGIGPHRTPTDPMGDVLEVKVFRSRGRKRILPDVQNMPVLPAMKTKGTKQKEKSKGVELVNAGILPPKCPQRYYRYALLDPLDKPFATFRFYYRSMDELAALNVIPRTTSESSTSDTGSISSQDEPIDGDTETASRSQYEDSENEVALSTPTRSGYSPQNGSSPMSSLQRLAQAPTFSSPLSVISEEVQTPEPLKASRARVPNPSEIDDSPLRIPHPTTNDASKFESDRPSTKTPNKRSPSPPQPASIGSSKYASPQPPTFSGPRVSGSSENETQGPQRSIATSYLSKESFKSLIQDCMPIPDAATLQIADTIKVDDGDRQEEQNKGAPKPGSSISVGSLRKVFEKSGNGSRSKRNR